MSETEEMMLELQRVLRRRERDIVGLLGRFVRCESPSHHKAAVDRLGRIVASEWRRRGAKVRVLRQKARGNHVRAEIWMGSGRAGWADSDCSGTSTRFIRWVRWPRCRFACRADARGDQERLT